MENPGFLFLENNNKKQHQNKNVSFTSVKSCGVFLEKFASIHWSFHENFKWDRGASSSFSSSSSAVCLPTWWTGAVGQQSQNNTWTLGVPLKTTKREKKGKNNNYKKKQQSNAMEGFWELKPESFFRRQKDGKFPEASSSCGWTKKKKKKKKTQSCLCLLAIWSQSGPQSGSSSPSSPVPSVVQSPSHPVQMSQSGRLTVIHICRVSNCSTKNYFPWFLVYS